MRAKYKLMDAYATYAIYVVRLNEIKKYSKDSKI